MKKFAKFIPVALGLLTLASCSNDNLFGESQDAVQLKDGDMVVTMAEPQEDGEAFTRGYTSRDAKTRRWFSGVDILRVYGLSFDGPFDTYEFIQGLNADKGQFRRVNSSTSLADPSWALFPENQIVKGKWEQLPGLYNSKVTVDMSIPQVVEYDAAYDAANYDTDKQPYYLDNLPRWGKVTGTNNGANLETKLSWMTGVLRLQLAGAPKYSNGIMVQMFENGDRSKPIRLNSANGKNWNVQIAHNNQPVDGACIEFTPGDYATGLGFIDGALYVHMDNVDKLTPEDAKKAVVFLPLPVTKGKLVDIVVSVWDYAKAGKNEWKGDAMAAAAHYPGTPVGLTFADCWKEYAVYTNKNIKLGYLYGNKNEYNLALDGTSPTAISDALELTVPDADDIIRVTANNGIDVCDGVQETTIEIPNKDGRKIILDLRKGLKGCSAAPDLSTLNIVYKDATDPHTGEVVLITPATVTGTDNKVKLNVDLPKSAFTLVQGGTLENTNFGDIDIDAVQFTVGNDDETTPTNISAEKIKLSNNVKTFVVAKEGQIGAFNVIQTHATLNRHEGVNKIIINGKATDPIDARTYVPDTYEVNVEVTGEKAYANDIFTYGEVNIHDLGLEAAPTVVDDILAKKVTADGWATLGTIGTVADPIAETITLTGNIATSNIITGDALVANGDISISQEANVPTGAITSNEGSITIDNAYTATTSVTYGGNITAEKGIVSLNQVGDKKTIFTGVIVANEFEMTGKTAAQNTGNTVTAHGTATIDVDAQDGVCPAVYGSLILDNPTTNTLNLFQGYVFKVVNPADVETSLTFSSDATYTAIANVVNPDKLIPTNVSKWNGDYKIEAYSYFGTAGYNHDNGRIWTATQLGYMNTTALYNYTVGGHPLEIRNNIDLDNQKWPGIMATSNLDIIINGNGKTISNLNLIGNSSVSVKFAGFYNTCYGGLTVNDLTFDGVKTTIAGVSGGVYEHGIGAIVGRAEGTATLTRVNVKLVGDNFGAAYPVKNAQTNYVGGLIGVAVGNASLIGSQVDATGAILTGYKSLGGFIGKSMGDVTIRMAEEDFDKGIPEAYPTVTGLKFYVTYDATKAISGEKNDQFQGSTGWFIGSINYKKNLTISDIQTSDLKRKIDQAAGSLANEKVACWIESTTDYYWFVRSKLNGQEKADQTLVGNSGFEYISGDAGDMKINNVRFEIHKSGASLKDSDSKKLYSIIKDAYNH